ncbi:hypothetical protein [Pseudomonas simiae]|uniref:hypothetical protein n=1 Tax=Pseudomonas simiae TaxID=321846 RepID=UPI0033152DB3
MTDKIDNNVFDFDAHKAKKVNNHASEGINQLHQLIKGLDESCVFNLREGVIEEILFGNDDQEKIKFITHLLGEIFTHGLIKDEIKLQCMGAFTYGLNLILHGDLEDDEVSES